MSIHSDHNGLLMQELVTGYRTYAEPADLGLSAAGSAPETTVPCSFIASFTFTVALTDGPGN